MGKWVKSYKLAPLPSPRGGAENRDCRSRERVPRRRRRVSPAARGYAIQKPVRPSQEDDPPPSTLLKDHQDVPGIDKVDDVGKRLLSLEMGNQKEKLKVKKEQLMNKVVANPEDTSALEARIVALTVKIRNYEEHMQKHRKDKALKRYLITSIDQRQKMLKNLSKTNYKVFEKMCKDLGTECIFPPMYYRRAHRRWVAKKALCILVYQEAQKLKKQRRALKAAAAAQKQRQTNPISISQAEPEAIKENK
ncbi:28S ribosomal protein S15, mitochondrial-like [Pipistrellus kuhlii]|uniref:28S ribosomal protein S15, mitochondrial-like n=1 Tax=Pipistrellus kuhlii TaxID=59472 RepID=UPI00174F0F3B|nr:28S ribosomal protein S15, mitochondrial-like [Pipistrellus kuhlii]